MSHSSFRPEGKQNRRDNGNSRAGAEARLPRGAATTDLPNRFASLAQENEVQAEARSGVMKDFLLGATCLVLGFILGYAVRAWVSYQRGKQGQYR